jgi:ribose-phosphate pyrophosphokinase
MKRRSLFLSLAESRGITKRLSRGAKGAESTVLEGTFPDGEAWVRLRRTADGRTIVVAPQTGDWGRLGRFLMALRALRERGERPEVFIPMLPYGRADTAGPGEARTALLFADLVAAAGSPARVAIIEPHSNVALPRFRCPVTAVEPLAALAALACGRWRPEVILAPDRGALPRSRCVAESLGVRSVAVIRKERLGGGRVRVRAVSGTLRGRVLIVDDIVATGGTLLAAAQAARARGAEEVRALAVHGVFAPGAREAIRLSALSSLTVSDTLLPAPGGKIQVVPLLEPVGRILYGTGG